MELANTQMLTKERAPSLKAAHLRYVTDTKPGISRRHTAKGFRYLNPDGTPLHDEATLKRIAALAIPPAYTDVWICPSENGYLQATGRDARGRKQYRYHVRWRAVRDENKYGRMIAFGEALPRIRERVDHDLSLPGLPREKVLATVVRLLETTLIRVGNEEYARTNKSYGLTTLQNRHVAIEGSTLHFHFRGKSGVTHTIDLRDRKLASIVKRCRELPGHELFEYCDENGTPQTIGSADVNMYLHEIAGNEFTAKDFRTWAGTMLAALTLQEFEAFTSETQAKKNIVQAIASVSERLGNTPSVCRKCYVHPAVLESYLDGSLLTQLKQTNTNSETAHALHAEEASVMRLLQQRLKDEQSRCCKAA